MTRGVRGTGPNGELTPEQVAERDLEWLQGELSWDLYKVLDTGEDLKIIAFLRGVARTANTLARHYEKRLGIPATKGRKAKDASTV